MLVENWVAEDLGRLGASGWLVLVDNAKMKSEKFEKVVGSWWYALLRTYLVIRGCGG